MKAIDENQLKEDCGRGPSGRGNEGVGNKSGLKEKQKANQQQGKQKGRLGKGGGLGTCLLETTKGTMGAFLFAVMMGTFRRDGGEKRQRNE
jgi:hypothetical protein